MKFSCTQENLRKGLTIVNHVASKHTTLPILNNVLLRVENNVLKLSTTNLEIGVNCVIRGKVEQEGTTTVQAKLLNDYINLLPKETLNLNLDGNRLQVLCGKNKTKINGISAEDFPVIPQLEKHEFSQINVKDFKKAISQIIFAVANDETRPEISGVYLLFDENNLTMVATDSYRLAEKKIKLTKSFSEKKEVIVPSRTLQELARILSDDLEEENINIVLSNNQIMFSLNGVELISRLVEGQYPDYNQIILDTFKTTATAKLTDLVNIVKTASLFCKIGINDVNVKLVSESNEIIISSSNSQLGENESKIESEIIGDMNEIVFNYKYFLDGLNSIDSTDVEIKLMDGDIQGLIKAKDKDDYRYIIMPVILN